jgi:hypothetical protein
VRDLKTWDRHIPGSGIITNYALYAYHDGSTEILSTGLEALFRDPVRFAKLAPEHFKVTMLALRKE